MSCQAGESTGDSIEFYFFFLAGTLLAFEVMCFNPVSFTLLIIFWCSYYGPNKYSSC